MATRKFIVYLAYDLIDKSYSDEYTATLWNQYFCQIQHTITLCLDIQVQPFLVHYNFGHDVNTLQKEWDQKAS